MIVLRDATSYCFTPSLARKALATLDLRGSELESSPGPGTVGSLRFNVIATCDLLLEPPRSSLGEPNPPVCEDLRSAALTDAAAARDCDECRGDVLGGFSCEFNACDIDLVGVFDVGEVIAISHARIAWIVANGFCVRMVWQNLSRSTAL